MAGTPSLSFSGATGSAAGGAAEEAEEEEEEETQEERGTRLLLEGAVRVLGREETREEEVARLAFYEMQREAQEAAAAAELPAARGALAKVLAKEEASVLEACAEWDRNWSGPSSAPSRSVVAAFGRLSAEARGAMADVLAAEYNYHYHFGSCRRQGVRERRRGVVAWAEGGSGLRRGEVVVVEENNIHRFLPAKPVFVFVSGGGRI